MNKLKNMFTLPRLPKLKKPKFTISAPTFSFSKKSNKPLSYSFSARRAKLSLKEQALFARRLSMLIKAGVPILTGLNILAKQSTSAANRNMVTRIARDVEEGQFLSKSMSRYKKVFGAFAINIVRIGETSGSLATNLQYLSDEVDKKRNLRAKVRGALMYPVVILVATFGVSGTMTVYLFPKLLPIFSSLGVPLPFVTRVLVGISNFLIAYWWAVFLGLAAFILGFMLLLRLPPFKFRVHRFVLRLPIVGILLQEYHLVNMCRTMGMLLKAQVRVLEASTIAAETSSSLVYQKQLKKLHEAITKGGSIAEYFEREPKLFPMLLTQMIAIGEKTGSLNDTLMYLADIYEQELDEQTARLSSVIEPIMMAIMGLMVGFLAVSIITPIYEVTQHIGPNS